MFFKQTENRTKAREIVEQYVLAYENVIPKVIVALAKDTLAELEANEPKK